jgi:SnoaL-like domain
MTSHLQSPQDIEEIRSLMHRYAMGIDAGGTFEGLAELFRHGDWTGRGGYEGSRAYAQSNFILYDGSTRTQHVVSNVEITILDAENAKATSYSTVFQQLEGEPIQVIAGLTYYDTFWRPDGPASPWAFKLRRLTMPLRGDLSKHLRVLPDYIEQ